MIIPLQCYKFTQTLFSLENIIKHDEMLLTLNHKENISSVKCKFSVVQLLSAHLFSDEAHDRF